MLIYSYKTRVVQNVLTAVKILCFQGRSIPKSTATVLEAGATPDREFTQRIDSNRKGSQKEKSPEPERFWGFVPDVVPITQRG